jgi:beta-glucosidase
VALTPLPARAAASLYVEGVDRATAAQYARVVDRPQDADLALLRVGAPFEQRTVGFEQFFHAGRLNYTAEELSALNAVTEQVPTVVDVFLDRPAILTGIDGAETCLMADFGASDTAVLDIVFGRAAAAGRLPFELPRTPEQVAKSREDVPRDSGDPLFPFGHGITR